MIEIQKTEDFEACLSDLKDRVGKAKIVLAFSASNSATPVTYGRSEKVSAR